MLQKNSQVRLGSILTLSLIFALVGGCGDYENNVYQGNRDGVLHVGNGTEPQSLDPHIATGVPEHHIISAVMEGLVAKDRKTLMPKPGVAESWTISDDLTVYTFKLRTNARWQRELIQPMTMLATSGEPCNRHLAISMLTCSSQ